MSILNGAYAPETLLPDPAPFGRFEVTGTIDLTNALDADALETPDGKLLVTAGRCKLMIHRLKGGVPELISELTGLGDSRQIMISDGFAYVTARADGLYICDLRDYRNPKLVRRLDTLELATGVCAGDGLLAVTNRHMGCELWDVRDPYHPGWLGSFYCGEAQSVWLHESNAFIGDWMNRLVRIFNISDPTKAVEISRFAVDGFADGVCVTESKDGRTLCLCATGHHSARLKNRRKYKSYDFVTPEMLAEGYGCGHGVEIFDVTDPYDPEYVSSIKSPPHFGGYDTWRVFAGEGFCYFTDSMNGVFELDLSDIHHPRFTKNFRLPVLERQNPTPPSIQLRRYAITGATLIDGFVCAAGETGVTIARGVSGELSKPSAKVNFPEKSNHIGQYHSFARLGGRLYIAAGDEGVIVRDKSGEKRFPTKGACLDIIAKDGLIITAENGEGAAVCSPDLTELSRLEAEPLRPVRELVDCGNYIAAQLGSTFVQALELTGSELKAIGEPLSVGLLYHRHLARHPAGEYPITLSLSGGPALLQKENGFKRTGLSLRAETCPIEEGADGCRCGLILIFNAKYWYLEDPADIANLPAPIPCPGARLKGQPFVCGDKLVLLNRVNGVVEIIDITDPEAPVFERLTETRTHPEFAAELDGRINIACGHGGLIVI